MSPNIGITLTIKKQGDAEGDETHDHRIGHRRFHLFLQARARLQIARQPIQDFRQQPARLPGFHHAHVQLVEHLGMLRQRLRECMPLLHLLGRLAQHGLERLAVRLFFQRGQRLHQRQSCVHHRRQLPGEHDQVLGLDLALTTLLPRLASRPCAYGNDHQAAIHQRRSRRLCVCRLDVAIDRTPGGVARLIYETRHSPLVSSLLPSAKILPCYRAANMPRRR